MHLCGGSVAGISLIKIGLLWIVAFLFNLTFPLHFNYSPKIGIVYSMTLARNKILMLREIFVISQLEKI